MERNELIKFFEWLNDWEELKFTPKGINFYVDKYLSEVNIQVDENESKITDRNKEK